MIHKKIYKFFLFRVMKFEEILASYFETKFPKANTI